MKFEIWLLCYAGFLIFGSLAVTGWYFITRGEIKVREDGSKVKTGKIFRDWYFYWTKTKPNKEKVFLNEANLYELYLKIRDQYRAKELFAAISVEGTSLMFKSPEKFNEERRWIEKAFTVKFFDKGGGMYAVYKEYDDFVFPAWVRDPLAVCATCSASVYGSIFYWLLIALVDVDLFAWSSAPMWAAFAFWVAFCFTLSVLNTALAKAWN